MFPGLDAQHFLMEVSRRQSEVRGERLARRPLRALRGRKPSSFRIWRLHVMVWLEGPWRV